MQCDRVSAVVVRPLHPKRSMLRRANLSGVELVGASQRSTKFQSQIISAVGSKEEFLRKHRVLKRRSFSILSLAAERKYGPRRAGLVTEKIEGD